MDEQSNTTQLKKVVYNNKIVVLWILLSVHKTNSHNFGLQDFRRKKTSTADKSHKTSDDKHKSYIGFLCLFDSIKGSLQDIF